MNSVFTAMWTGTKTYWIRQRFPVDSGWHAIRQKKEMQLEDTPNDKYKPQITQELFRMAVFFNRTRGRNQHKR